MKTKWSKVCLVTAVILCAGSLSGSVWAEDEYELSDAVANSRLRNHSVVDSAANLLRANSLSNAAVPNGVTQGPLRSPRELALAASMQLMADMEFAAGQQSNAMFGPLRAAVRPLPEAPDVEAIIGGETWKVVKNTKSTPYKAICYIEATFPSGNSFNGTGAFVGPRVLLTVAHLCYDSAEGGFATTLRVYPGRNGSSSPFGSQVALFPAVPTLWTTTEESNSDYDIAWIVLPDTTLHNKVKYYFGYRATTDSELRDAKLNMSGYPGTKGKKQYYEANKTAKQDVSAMQFKHYLDTVGGSSGSPMYLLPKKRQIVGVNCAEYVPIWPFNPYNIATRMTNDYYNITKQYNTSYH